MSVNIRKATYSDLESIYTLVCDLEECMMDNDSFTSVFSKNLKDPNVVYLVAEKGKEIVGFLSLHVQYILHHAKPTCELQEFIIVSDFRGTGIGKLLMQEAEKTARSFQLEEIELTTKIHRKQAQHFYDNLGFRFTHMKFVKKLS